MSERREKRSGRFDRSDRSDRSDKFDKFDKFDRNRRAHRFLIPEGEKIDYKNISLLQKFITDRGKIQPRRISGVSAKEQRALVAAIKQARFLSLVPSGNRAR